MWSDIIGKLQQKIDDAAEYLQEDDSEVSDDSISTSRKEASIWEKSINIDNELLTGKLVKENNNNMHVEDSKCEEQQECKSKVAIRDSDIKELCSNAVNETFNNELKSSVESKQYTHTENVPLTNNEQQTLPIVKEHVKEAGLNVVKQHTQVDDSDIDILITKLGKERERNKKLSAERNALKNELALLRTSNMSLENRLNEEGNAHSATTEAVNTETNNVKSVKSSAEESKSIEQLEEENKSLTSTLSITTLELEKARNSLHKLQMEFKETDRCTAAFTAEREKQLEEREEYYKRLLYERQCEYEKEVVKLQNELVLAKQQTELLEQRNRELELSSFSSLRENHATVESLQHKVSSIRLELQEEHKTNEVLRRELITMKNSAENNEKEWRSRVKELTNLLEELSSERNNIIQQKNSLQLELDKSRREREAIDNTMKRNTFNNNHEDECSIENNEEEIHDTKINVIKVDDTTTTINEHNRANTTSIANHTENVVSEQNNDAADKATSLENCTLMFPSLLDNSITRNVRSEQKTINRLQRQLIEQSIELERLMKVEANANEMKSQYVDLNLRYNTILEMYGQLEEKFSHNVSDLEKDRLKEEEYKHFLQRR